MFLAVIDFTSLIGPIFSNEKYDMEKLSSIDQEMKAQHEAIWKDLDTMWKQFWTGKINARFAKFYPFFSELENSVKKSSTGKEASSNWDINEFLNFYYSFLQENSSWQSLAVTSVQPLLFSRH